MLLGQKAKVWASSTLKAKNPRRYSVRNAFDGKPETAWVEGAPGPGDGESLTVEFPRPVTLSGFWIVPGYAKSLDLFLRNRAPTRLVLSVDGRELGQYKLNYVVELDEEAPESTCSLVEDETNLAPRIVIFPQPVSGQRLQLTLRGDAPSKWAKYDDLAISEWGLLPEAPTHKNPRPPAQVSTAAALLLGYARSGRLPPDFLTGSPQVQDVLAPLQNVGADWMQQGIRDALLQAGADPAQAPLRNFETIARGAFIGVPVTAVPTASDDIHLVGSQLFSVGDGEWLEYYPVVTLEDEEQLRWLGALGVGGGAPGCHDVLPNPRIMLLR